MFQTVAGENIGSAAAAGAVQERLCGAHGADGAALPGAATEYLFDIHFSYTAFDGWLSASILLLLPVITSIYP